MKTVKNLIICSALLSLMSCAKYVSTNYCTTPENIWKLEKDMSLAQINATLGVEPYDVIINDQTQNKVLIYKYRLRTQETDANDENQLRNYNETFVSRDEIDLYVILDSKSNKMQQYITSTGRKDAEDVQRDAYYFKNILPEVIKNRVK